MINFTKKPSETTLVTFNQLVLECSNLFEENGSLTGNNILQAQLLENSLMYRIVKETNFDSVFQSLKIAYQYPGFPFIHQILSNMKINHDESTIFRLIDLIGQEARNYEKQPLRIYRFFIPCRLTLELDSNQKDKLNKTILDATGVQIIERLPDQYLAQIKDGKFKRFFNWERSVLNVDVEARDRTFAGTVAEKKLLCLLGFIGFVNHYPKTTIFHWSLDGNEAYCENPLEKQVALFENNVLLYPEANSFPSLEFQIKDTDLSLVNKECWVVHNKQNGNYQDLLRLLSFSYAHKDHGQILCDSLKIYFSAITEKLPELAFLKFWISFEILMKKGEKTKDSEYIQKLKEQNIFPGDIIDSLYKKRCDVAHEYKTDFVSFQEVSFAKDIAETTLLNIDRFWNKNA